MNSKHKKFLPIILLFITAFCWAKEPVKVLFVGNSLTYFHDMPQTVQKMLDEVGDNAKIEQITSPGATLSSHLFRIDDGGSWRRLQENEVSVAVTKIIASKWDYVILQEGPVALLIPESQKYAVEPVISKLDSIIKIGQGKTILYQAYALKENYPRNHCFPGSAIQSQSVDHAEQLSSAQQYCSDSFMNIGDEYKVLKRVYAEVAGKINAKIAPVGDAFESARIVCPEIELYENDFSGHPSKAGAYLIACVFYRTLTGKKVSGVKYTSGLRIVNAKKLQSVADGIRME